MIAPETVAASLIDKLAEIYPKPATWKAIAARIAAVCHEGVTGENLEALAERIIESRKQKTFPAVSDLLMLVKAIPVVKVRGAGDSGLDGLFDPVSRRRVRSKERGHRVGGHMRYFGFGSTAASDRDKAFDEAEERAIRFLRGTPLAARAIAENWATGLLSFAVAEGCAPGLDEEREIVAKVRANDVDVRDFADVPNPVPQRRNVKPTFKAAGSGIGHALRKFRADMHAVAARKLGGTSNFEPPTEPPQAEAGPTEVDLALTKANQEMFERDCRAAGVDPAKGVSPALLRNLGQLPAHKESR